MGDSVDENAFPLRENELLAYGWTIRSSFMFIITQTTMVFKMKHWTRLCIDFQISRALLTRIWFHINLLPRGLILFTFLFYFFEHEIGNHCDAVKLYWLQGPAWSKSELCPIRCPITTENFQLMWNFRIIMIVPEIILDSSKWVSYLKNDLVPPNNWTGYRARKSDRMNWGRVLARCITVQFITLE